MNHEGTKQRKHEKGITNAQKALLHVAAQQLGLHDGTYRDILERFGGVTSSVVLTQEGFRRVMEHLGSCGFEKAQSSKLKAQSKNDYKSYYEQYMWQLGNRAGMGSVGQLALIETLWDQLEWYWNKDGNGNRKAALRGFLLGRFGCEHVVFLNFETAGKVIEGLKKIQSRKHERKKARKKNEPR